MSIWEIIYIVLSIANQRIWQSLTYTIYNSLVYEKGIVYIYSVYLATMTLPMSYITECKLGVSLIHSWNLIEYLNPLPQKTLQPFFYFKDFKKRFFEYDYFREFQRVF